jgi:hypothetical protein
MPATQGSQEVGRSAKRRARRVADATPETVPEDSRSGPEMGRDSPGRRN